MYYCVNKEYNNGDEKMRFALILFLFISLISCKKAADPTAESYAGQDSSYCNDPVAINYNYDFPGTANNLICIYPTDPFAGTFSMLDSVFTADLASFYVIEDTITIYPLSKTKMAIIGLCGPNDSIKLTAGRYYRATIDTTILIGQPLCSPKDTINGTFTSDAASQVKFNFTKFSDTAGIKYHRGVATLIQ
jgi:hypothetical protein